ncbi:7010_t:CDS:2, partial [Paraglomus occultum]
AKFFDPGDLIAKPVLLPAITPVPETGNYLVAQATSVPSERIFSIAKHTVLRTVISNSTSSDWKNNIKGKIFAIGIFKSYFRDVNKDNEKYLLDYILVCCAQKKRNQHQEQQPQENNEDDQNIVIDQE